MYIVQHWATDAITYKQVIIASTEILRHVIQGLTDNGQTEGRITEDNPSIIPHQQPPRYCRKYAKLHIELYAKLLPE